MPNGKFINLYSERSKKMKKTISIILTLLLLFSVVSSVCPVLAADINNGVAAKGVYDDVQDAVDAAQDVDVNDLNTTFNFMDKFIKVIHKIVHTLSDIFKFDCPFCEKLGIENSYSYDITFSKPDSMPDLLWQQLGLSSVSVTEGTLIKDLKTPELKGYKFLGWYYDSGLTRPADENDAIVKKTSLYPKFEEDNTITTIEYHSVNFDYPAGMTEEEKQVTMLPSEQIARSGDLVYSMPTPYREGYVFNGWYYDAALAVIADTDDIINKNITLYPSLVPEEYVSEIGEGALNYVAAIDVPASFRVTVKAPSADAVKNGITFVGVTDGNAEMPFTVIDNSDGTYTINPVDGLEEGKTYQITATDRESLATPENPVPAENEYILFIHEDEVQKKEVRYYNIFTYRDEVENLRIDNDVKFIDLSNVSGFGMAEAAGLYSLRMEKTGEVSLLETEVEGTFMYEGTPALKVGDIVAIHKGDVDEENGIVSDETEVAYVEITKVDGMVYYYVSADPTDVIFLPEVIPVAFSADIDGNRDDNTITVSADILDFTNSENQQALNCDTVVSKGDYLALYDGVLGETEEAVYVKVLTRTDNADGTVTFTTESSTVEEIKSAIDTYTRNAIPVNIPESEIKILENKLADQAEESGFAEEAAGFMLSARLGMPEELEYGETYEMTSEQVELFGIEVDGGNIMYQVEIGKPNVKAEVGKSLKKVTQIGNAEGLRVDFGVTIPVGIEVVENGWHVIESITVDLYVTFEQEVAFNSRFSVDVEWDNWLKIIWWIDDVVVDAGFEFGTYTGIGAITTASTAKYYEKSYLWKELVEDENGNDIFSSSSSIATKLNKALSNGDLSFFEELYDGSTLIDKYSEMLKREIDYFDIFALPLFHSKGYLDPKTHIVNYILDIELVFGAKLNVAMGISFENLDVKEYSFHFGLFDGDKSYKVVDKQTPFTNFNFFIFGNLGVRAGISLTFTVGLVSTKLDNIGVHIEVGPYLEIYGFYYYHFEKIGNKAPVTKSGGAVLFEIGIYLALDFFAGAFMDLVSVEVHLVDESWPIYETGNEWYVVEAEFPEDDIVLYSKNPNSSSKLSDGYFNVREFNIKTGEMRTVKKSKSDYTLVTANTYGAKAGTGSDKITYNPSKGFEIKADANDSELSAEFTFMLKNPDDVIGPVTKTINVTWVRKFAIEYLDAGYIYGVNGSSVAHTGSYRETPLSGKTIALESGKKIPKLSEYKDEIKHRCDSIDFVGWRIDCPTDSAIHGKLLHEVNYLENYAMPNDNIVLHPEYRTSKTVEYTVRHLAESSFEDGKYDVLLEEKFEGYPYDEVKDFNFLDEPSLLLDYDRYPYRNKITFIVPEGGMYAGSLITYTYWHKIAPDGSTVIDIYYERAPYLIELYANNPVLRDYDSSYQTATSYKIGYGEEVPAPDYVYEDNEYFTFLGWSTTPDGPVEITELPEIAEGSSYVQRYYGVWDYKEADITCNFYIYKPGEGYRSTPDVVEVMKLPYGKRDFIYSLSPTDKSLLDGHWATERKGVYEDGRAYTKSYVTLDADGTTFDIHLYASYNQVIFGSDIMYYHYGDHVIAPEAPEKVGYDFAYWKSNMGSSLNLRAGEGFDISYNTSYYFTAVYTPSTDTTYTVNHYYEKLNKGNYEEPITEILTGTTDATVKPAVKPQTGFDTPAVREVTISADGNTVVNYYYDRSTYSVYLDADGGIVRGSNAATYRYGEAFFLFDSASYSINKTGKIFVGWYWSEDESQTLLDESTYVDGNAIMSCSDLTFIAKYEDKPIEYHVEHYLQQLDGSFALQQTDKPTGVLNATVTATPVTFAGFTVDADNENNVLNGVITSEQDIVVLQLYYVRESYTAVWLDYDNITELGRATFVFGQEIILPENIATPQRDEYRFDSWKNFGTMPARDVVLSAAEYGNWTADNGPYDLVIDLAGDSIKYYDMFEGICTYETDDITASVKLNDSLAPYFENETIVAFLNEEYAGYTFDGWYDSEGNLYDGDETMPAGNLTITARWKPMDIKVTFFNGSNALSSAEVTGETFSETYSYGDIIDIPTDHGFTAEGYFISGWKVGEGYGGNGQGATISNQLVLLDGYNEDYLITEKNEYADFEAGEFYIFPVWTADYYKGTVTFNSNGGVGVMQPQLIDASGYNMNELNFNKFTYDGYKFIGWTTTPEYDPDIDWLIIDGDSFTTEYGSSITDYTLYAQWEKISE
jgi:uncharacterized repeat protein (TIGR02543 family)